MTVRNNTRDSQMIDSTTLYLEIDNQRYNYQTHLRNNFIDIGEAYTNEPIGPEIERDLVFIFELKSDVSINNSRLRILREVVVDEERQANFNYATFNINPRQLNNPPTRLEVNINEKMYLGETLYLNSNLVITKAELLSKYEYKYELCRNDDCRELFEVITPTNPIRFGLLVLTYDLQITPDISLGDTVASDKAFFDRFLKIEYNFRDRAAIDDLVTRTFPALENMLFVDIPRLTLSSERLNLKVQTRDFHYFLNLKPLQ